MKRLLSTHISSGALNLWLLLFRISTGAIMLTHGIPKFQKLMAGDIMFADPFGLGMGPSLTLTVFAEAGCSILLIFGLVTRFAVIPLIATMLVAIFSAHASDPFAKKELAVVFVTVYLTFLVLGPGRYSIDNTMAINRNRRR